MKNLVKMHDNLNYCKACLSTDRKLVLIDQTRYIIQFLRIKELAKSQGYLCWECYTIIMKFLKFRTQARNVQEIMASEYKHKKTYSHLGVAKVKHFDYQFEFIEPVILENNETTEPILVKQEPDDDFDDEGTVFVDVIECKKEKVLPNKRLASKRLSKERSKDSKIQSKKEFQMIMLTDKRMASKRLAKDKLKKDTKKDSPEEFQLVMSTEEELTTKRLSKDMSLLTTKSSKRLPSKRLSKDKLLKDTNKDPPEEFQLVMSTKEETTPKRLSKDMSTKRLPTKRSKDTPDLSNKLEMITEKGLESQSLPAKRLSIKRLSAKTSKDTPDLSNKFELVTLTDEEVSKSRAEKRNHHNYKKLPYKCDYCVLGFMKKEYYDSHMATKHDESKGKPCDVCAVRFTNLIVLHNHRNLHYQHFRCKLCEYKGNTHMAIVNHVTEKHKDDSIDKIHCKLCTECFGNREEISEHMRTDHTLYCNECGEKFKTKGNLRLHLKRVHTTTREYTCPERECNKRFSSRSRLESHVARHGGAPARRLAYCALCRVQYKGLAVYRSHLRNSLHHVQDKFPCPDCDKKFASKSYWKKHYNFYHLKKSQHKCEECDKIFMSYFLLKGHRQKYHGLTRPRNHICNVCQKSFYNVTNLRAHMQIHSSHRAYMCAECGDTFKQRPALYTHQRLVHSDTK